MDQNLSTHIARLLLSKSSAKQTTYQNLCNAFASLKESAIALVEEINAKTQAKHPEITVQVDEIGEKEFRLKVAGDLLIFHLHTNIITLGDEYSYNKSDYVAEDPNRKYLGQINIYNFMADSLKYNRLNDPGYLMCRFLINHENRFIVEGDRQINFMFEALSMKPLEKMDLDMIIQMILVQAIETDLVVPAFPDIRELTLHEKLESMAIVGGGHKIGFKMQSMNDSK